MTPPDGDPISGDPPGGDGTGPAIGRRSPIFRRLGRRDGHIVRPAPPLRMIVPNAITLLSMAAGLTAIRFAMQDRFEHAVLAILIAGLLDGVDGRIARLINGTSKFGAELDSLADFLNFGIAPALVLYLWSLNALGGVGWIAVLAFAACTALRLARFNVALEDPNRPAWTMKFFTGVPTPSGAALALAPMYAAFAGLEWVQGFPFFVALTTIGAALLMVSRLPTYSLKGIKLQQSHVLPVLIGVVFVAAIVANYPWLSFMAISAGYIASLPLASRSYQEHRARDKAAA